MIGKKFYIYDINNRIYFNHETGKKSQSPIWKYYWVEKEIVNETKISWIDNYGKKWKKKDFKESHVLLFAKESIEKIAQIKKIKSKMNNLYNKGDEIPENYERFKKIEQLLFLMKTVL